MKYEIRKMKAVFLLCLSALWMPACTVHAYTYPDQALIKNFARAIITATDGLATNDTELTVSVVTNFPTITSTNEYYYLVLLRTSDGAKEIVKVTACDTETKTLTIERAQDNTAALVFARNDRVELWVTAGLLEDYRQEQRGYVDEKAVENALDLTVARGDISNLVLRLSGTVGTGKLDIATFDALAFAIDTNGNISVAVGGLKTDDYSDGSITGDKISAETLAPSKIGTLSGKTLVGNISTNSGAASEIPIETTFVGASYAIPTAAAVKTYADSTATEQAKVYVMQYSGATAFTGSMPTSFTDLDLSGTIGTNRCFVHLSVKTDSTVDYVAFRTNLQTEDIARPVGSGATAGGAGTSASAVASGSISYFSLITDILGVIEWRSASAGSGGTIVKVLCYQVLQ
jgi:hypothetical protein